MSIVICCIAKNEDLYINEWINYHLNLGFSKIYIYDNSFKNLLKDLNSNKIKVIHYPGACKQYLAYNDFLKTYSFNHMYAAIIDCDEFIVLKKHDNINHFLEDYNIDTGICINWKLFGSNGHIKYSSEPVLERFTMCQNDLNIHVKCIIKCCNVFEYNNPHCPTNYFGSIKDTNNNIIIGPFNSTGTYDVAQINHYFTKSKEEFELKRLRGMADNNKIRNLDDFNLHDRNEIKEIINIKKIMSAVVCVIAKHEELYIDEWINYNLNLGFTKIYVYDNSDDNSLKYLNSDSVKVIHYPGICKQFEAYNNFITNYKEDHTYVAFIDCDEFIVLKQDNNILDICTKYIKDDSGGLAINWKFFGSNGHEKYSPEPVMKRFTKSQKGINNHIKCIVKCSDIIQYNHPHYPTIISNPVKDFDNNIIIGPFNDKGNDKIAQINHYFTKSKEEFIKKCERGRADIPMKRLITEFEAHDFNEIDTN
jgi:hypothetical protein